MNAFYRRRLPHLQYNKGVYFVTFGLSGFLPRHAIGVLKKRYDEIAKQYSTDSEKLRSAYFKKYSHLLDGGRGPFWLNNSKVAKLVADKIHSFDGIKYLLICFTIMPNHVHLLFDLNGSREESHGTTDWDPAARYPVTHILKLIKGSTARKANKILGRSGSFWHHESYDRLVRTGTEKENIIRYILENPVKAGLAVQFDEWEWNYCREEDLPVR